MIWVWVAVTVLAAIGVDPCVAYVPVCVPASQA